MLHSSEPEGAQRLTVDEATPQAGHLPSPPASRTLPIAGGSPLWLPARWRQPGAGYLAAALLQVLAVLSTWVMTRAFSAFNFPSALPLLVVAFVALSWGAGPSILALLLGAVFIDYFLLSPGYSWSVRGNDLIGLAVFLVVGLLISRLAGLHKRVRRAAEALAESLESERARLQATFEAIPDPITFYDAQGTLVSANPAGLQNIGARPFPASLEAMSGAYRVRTAQGDPLPVEQLPVARALRGEMVNEVEVVTPGPDGNDRIVLTGAAPIRSRQGQITGVVATSHDMTERRRLEREATERAGQLEAVFNSMTDGLVVFDAQGHLLQMNGAARSLLSLERVAGYSLEQASSGSSRFSVRDEQGRPLKQQEWPISRILQGETLTGANVVDLLLRSLDGHEVQVSVSGAPVLDEQGAIAGAISVIHDVTERRRLERRTQESLQALLDMAQTLVQEPGEEVPTGQNGLALRVVARRLAELTRRVIGGQRTAFYSFDAETERFSPLAVVGLLPEQEQQWLADPGRGHRLGENLPPALARRFLAGEVIVIDMREPPLRDIPNPYQVRTLMAAPLLVGQRLVGQFILDFGPEPHDFTPQEMALAEAVGKLAALVIDRDRLLREREEARASALALREANRRMDEFLGIASHELRTPLTKVKTSIQLAEHRAKAAVRQDNANGTLLAKTLQPIQEMIGRGGRSVDVVNRLVGDLLDVSRIQADRLEVRLVPVDLIQVVREVVEEQRELFPHRTITLTVPAHLPTLVTADAERIAQVVINYLTNALKYSPEALPVEVGVRVDERAARVWVRDQGPGIPADAQAHLWERFYQVQGVAVQQGSSVGLGLGLYISRTIIERHGGQIGVESAPGKGATFWFTLPLAG